MSESISKGESLERVGEERKGEGFYFRKAVLGTGFLPKEKNPHRGLSRAQTPQKKLRKKNHNKRGR